MDYDTVLFLLAYTGIQILATMSPGPAFALVTQRSLSGGRSIGIAAALGCGAGVALWLVATVVGLTFVVAKFAWLDFALKVAGGAFLIYLAVMLWRHAIDPANAVQPSLASPQSAFSAFRAGVITNLANPKALAFFGSVLITILPADMPLWMKIAVIVIGTAVEGLWFAFVAFAFSTASFRRRYLSYKSVLDKTMGGVLGVLGMKLLLDAA